jgi:hypothetical protein
MGSKVGSKTTLELVLILASDSSPRRGVETGPLAKRV